MKFITILMLFAIAVPAGAQKPTAAGSEAKPTEEDLLDAELDSELALDDDSGDEPIAEVPSLQFPTLTQAVSVPTKDCEKLQPTPAMLALRTVHKPEFIGVFHPKTMDNNCRIAYGYITNDEVTFATFDGKPDTPSHTKLLKMKLSAIKDALSKGKGKSGCLDGKSGFLLFDPFEPTSPVFDPSSSEPGQAESHWLRWQQDAATVSYNPDHRVCNILEVK